MRETSQVTTSASSAMVVTWTTVMSGVPSSTSSGSPTAPFADAGRSEIEYRAPIQCVRVRKGKVTHSHFFFMRAGCFEGSAGSRNLVMARESSLNSTGFVT